MECNSNGANPIVPRSHYRGSLLLCFMVSVGICCAFLPVIPSEKGKEDSPQGDLTYIITRFVLTVFMILYETFVWYIVRKRDSFHKAQEVFWPLRCRHCARAVGFPQEHIQEGKTPISKSDLGSTSCHHLPLGTCKAFKRSLSLPNESGSDPVNDLGCSRKASMSKSLDNLDMKIHTHLNEHDMLNLYHGQRMDSCQMETQEKMSTLNFPSVIDRQVKGTSECRPRNKQAIQLYSKPHLSILNTFYIFGTFAVINLPIPIIANIMCIITLENSLSRYIVNVGQVLVDITFTALIFFAMLFFGNFYDAVFVAKEKFVIPLTITLASCFWIAMLKITFPLGAILTSKYGHPGYPCNLPGKFGFFVGLQERTLTPCYAECAIIGIAMIWQMWYSALPETLLKTTKGISEFQNLGPTYANPLCEKIWAFLKSICSCMMVKFTRLRSFEEERVNLLSTSKDTKDRRLNSEYPLNVPQTVAFLVFLGIAYFSLNMVLDYSNLGLGGSESTTEITLTYLKWFLQIVFYLPLLALYRYRILLTDSAKSFRPRKNVSLVSGLTGSHDRIILISCVGTFTLNIFRFVSSVGILLQTSRPPEDIVLACYTGVFAIFQTYSTWVMTSFLVVVQRQQIQGTVQTKWTLICLIYTGVLKATQWAIDSVEIQTWVELSAFYGSTQGMVIGVLLEPLTSLYGIHSAMIAYEAYKAIRNDIPSRLKSTKENDVSFQT